MKKQSKASRMDESLSMKHGKESTKKQSLASRRHESEGAKHEHHSHHAKSHAKKGSTAIKAKMARG